MIKSLWALCIFLSITLMIMRTHVNAQPDKEVCSIQCGLHRVNNYPVVEYLFNDRVTNPTHKSLKIPFCLTPDWTIRNVSAFTVQNPYWCANRVGLCIDSPAAGITGWPATNSPISCM